LCGKERLAAEGIHHPLPFLITPGRKTNFNIAELSAALLNLGNDTPMQHFKSLDPACAAIATC
jgi:hypothetical protein